MAAIHPKVKATGAVGVAAGLVIWALAALGVTLPPPVADALPLVIGLLGGWLKTA